MLYKISLGDIITQHELDYHFYADDSQLYDTTPNLPIDARIKKCETCVKSVKEWMGSNSLKLNGEKTEVLVIGSRKNLDKTEQNSITIAYSIICFKRDANNLGVVLDFELTINSHVKGLKKCLMIELRRISSIRHLITKDACQLLVSSVIFSKLDYCNSLLFGTSAENTKRLQGVQNNAARIVLGKKETR